MDDSCLDIEWFLKHYAYDGQVVATDIGSSVAFDNAASPTSIIFPALQGQLRPAYRYTWVVHVKDNISGKTTLNPMNPSIGVSGNNFINVHVGCPVNSPVTSLSITHDFSTMYLRYNGQHEKYQFSALQFEVNGDSNMSNKAVA